MRQRVQYKVPETETAKWNLAIFNVRAVARHRLALVWVIGVIIYTCAFPILWHIVSVFPRPAHLWLISLSDLPPVSSAEPRYKPFFLSDHLSFPSSFVLFCLFLFVSRWYFLTTNTFLSFLFLASLQWGFCHFKLYTSVSCLVSAKLGSKEWRHAFFTFEEIFFFFYFFFFCP